MYQLQTKKLVKKYNKNKGISRKKMKINNKLID